MVNPKVPYVKPQALFVHDSHAEPSFRALLTLRVCG